MKLVSGFILPTNKMKALYQSIMSLQELRMSLRDMHEKFKIASFSDIGAEAIQTSRWGFSTAIND